MRFTNILSAYHAGKPRSPQNPNKVPIQEILPLQLKERVSGKFDKTKEGGCLYEMTLVLSCLQENNYENKFCTKEVSNFNTCYKNYLENTVKSKKAQEKGLLVPGEKNLTHRQIRNMFKKYPLAR